MPPDSLSTIYIVGPHLLYLPPNPLRALGTYKLNVVTVGPVLIVRI